MESRDYEKILNAMPETGVYVIREEDHGILYFNKRVQEVSPDVRLGMACHDVWSGTCKCCPLLAMGDRKESRSVSYNDPFGGVVDITATRTVWEGTIPAFVITVAPRMETAGYTYRKIFRVDLERDCCDVLKTEKDSWRPAEGPLSAQLEGLARSGAIHPEDVERFVEFIRLEHLRRASDGDGGTLTLIYRRKMKDACRWNLMEVIPDVSGGGGPPFVILCVKDVHDVLREGLEREGISVRNQELIRSLGERNFAIYSIDLNSGYTDPIRVDGQPREELDCASAPWTSLMQAHIKDRLHVAYREEFQRKFSLEGLRRAKQEGQQKSELLCQWKSGESYRYISVTAYFGRELGPRSYTVLALQDVDEHIRQELANTQRDMQMAAILKSRYKMMNTVHLDSGLCDRISLDEEAGPQSPLTGDYAHYIQNAVDNYIHPEDVETYRNLLSLEHLREKAQTTEDYLEEVCQYRLRGEPVCWIELHVIYSRQGDQVMVNILGRDVTREKNQEEKRLQALEDRAYIISSLNALFFSIYYLDLEQDTYRAVNQLRRVGDVLGGEINYTAALRIYAENFVWPEDREAYLKTLSIENLRASLRWWNPYVAVEYRKQPECPGTDGETGGWVRATAVLAQSDADEAPKTVVYVAQDISDTKREYA